jgi:hypothetical protein
MDHNPVKVPKQQHVRSQQERAKPKAKPAAEVVHQQPKREMRKTLSLVKK